MGVDALALDGGVVVDDQHEVGGDVDIELAAPEVVLLGKFKRLDGVLGIAGFFTVPVATVGGDCDLGRA